MSDIVDNDGEMPRKNNNARRRMSDLEKALGIKKKYDASRKKRMGKLSARKPKVNRQPALVEAPQDWGPDTCEGFEDKTATKGLWGCQTILDVKTWIRDGFKDFNRKVRRAVVRRKIPHELKATLKALMSKTGATSQPVIINPVICYAAIKIISNRLAELAAKDPDFEIAFITFVDADGETSHRKTDIDLFSAQKKVTSTLRAMSGDFFGISELALFKNVKHPEGGQLIQRHEHALVFGKGVVEKAKFIAAKHAGRFKASFTGAKVIDVKRVTPDPVNIARMCAYLLKAPYRCKNWCPAIGERPAFLNNTEKGERFIHFLRLAQIRSMMTIEDVTFGGGEGASIRSDVIKYLRALALKDAAGGNRVLHPDAIASFWAEITTALKEDWNLPIIRRR